MGPAMQLIREVIIPNMQHTPGKGTPTQFRLVPFSIPGIESQQVRMARFRKRDDIRCLDSTPCGHAKYERHEGC